MNTRSGLLRAAGAALLFFCANAGLHSAFAAACIPVPQGLVSWWPAEGSTADVFGPNDGTPIGNVEYAPAEVGRGFRLSGSGYVEVADNSSLNLTRQFALVFWFNRDPRATGFQSLIGKRDVLVPAPTNFGVNFRDPDFGMGLFFDDPALDWPANGSDDENHAEVMRTPLPSAATWHLYVGQYRNTPGGVELRAFVDGELQDSQSFPTQLTSAQTGVPLMIGASSFYFEPFQGILDEVQIYARPLSAREIRRIYDAGPRGFCAPGVIAGLQTTSSSLERGPAGGAAEGTVSLDLRLQFAPRTAKATAALARREVSLSIGGFTHTLPRGALDCSPRGGCRIDSPGDGLASLTVEPDGASIRLEGIPASLLPAGTNLVLLRLGMEIGRTVIEIAP
jgi:hypothetical protein